MPYKSLKQERWAHTDAGEKALGGEKGVHEWDEASKGKDLPEKAPKMEGGGVVSYTPPTTDGNQPDEFDNDMKSGINHDLDAVKDYLMKHFGSTLGTDTTGLQGVTNNIANGGNGTLQPPQTDQTPGFAGGGITFRDRAKSGPAINAVPHPNYEGGGIIPGEFDVNTGDSDTLKKELTTEPGPPPSLTMPSSDNNYSLLKNNPVPVAPQTAQPIMSPAIPVKPQFNPMASHPASYQQPMAPAPVAAAMPPSAMLPGGGGSAVSDYVNQQKQALGQYGPEQQMALEKALQAQYRSPTQVGARALGTLGDALMQGVARAGNPGYEKQIAGEEAGQAEAQRNAFQRAGTQNLQQVEAKQRLDAIDPTSGLSKAKQEAYTPLLAKLGYSKNQIGKMSSADIESATALMAQYGGKQIEMMIKQFEIGQKQQEMNETHRANVAKEGNEQQKTGVEAAKELVTSGSPYNPLNPTTVPVATGARNVLAKAAGIQPLGVPDGRVAVVSPTGQIGHIPQSQLQAALAEGYKAQ